MRDFVHLSPTGYRLWAEAMEPDLAAMLGEKPVARATVAAGILPAVEGGILPPGPARIASTCDQAQRLFRRARCPALRQARCLPLHPI